MTRDMPGDYGGLGAAIYDSKAPPTPQGAGIGIGWAMFLGVMLSAVVVVGIVAVACSRGVAP